MPIDKSLIEDMIKDEGIDKVILGLRGDANAKHDAVEIYYKMCLKHTLTEQYLNDWEILKKHDFMRGSSRDRISKFEDYLLSEKTIDRAFLDKNIKTKDLNEIIGCVFSIYYDRGDYKQAISKLDSGIERLVKEKRISDTDKWDVYATSSELKACFGYYKSAINNLEICLGECEYKEDKFDYRIDTLRKLGDYNVRAGNNKYAVTYFKRAIKHYADKKFDSDLKSAFDMLIEEGSAYNFELSLKDPKHAKQVIESKKMLDIVFELSELYAVKGCGYTDHLIKFFELLDKQLESEKSLDMDWQIKNGIDKREFSSKIRMLTGMSESYRKCYNDSKNVLSYFDESLQKRHLFPKSINYYKAQACKNMLNSSNGWSHEKNCSLGKKHDAVNKKCTDAMLDYLDKAIGILLEPLLGNEIYLPEKDYDYFSALEMRAFLKEELSKMEDKKYMNEALHDFNFLIRRYPLNEVYLERRGNLKSALGDHKGAIDDFTKAIELDSEKDLYYLIGTERMKLKDYKSAIDDFLKSEEESSNLMIAKCKFRMKEYEDTIVYCNRAIKYKNKGLGPDRYFDSLKLRAKAKEKLGYKASAKADRIRMSIINKDIPLISELI